MLMRCSSIYISGKDDTDKRRVFDHPGLRVMAASPRHIFAMKARAARTRDIDDLRLLADTVGVESADTARAVIPAAAIERRTGGRRPGG